MFNTVNKYSALMLFVGLLQIGFGDAQTLAYYKTRSLDECMTVQESENMHQVSFYFPGFEDMEPLLAGYQFRSPGPVKLTIKKAISNNGEVVLFTRLFTKNIAKLIFSAGTETCSEKIELAIGRDGYQVPGLHAAGCIARSAGNTSILNVSVVAKDSSLPVTCIVGDLWIGTSEIQKHLSPSALFVQYPFDNAKKQQSFSSSPFDSYGLCAYFPKDQKEEDFKGGVFIEDSVKSTQQLLSEMFVPMMRNYPFYEQRNISRTDFVLRAANFEERYRNLPLYSYVDSLNSFISNNLKDAHFYLRVANKNRKTERSPVYVYKIDGVFKVAGVFDDSLKLKIPPGTNIVSINDKNISDGSFGTRDVNAFLKKQPGEKMKLGYQGPDGNTAWVLYTIKESYRTPAAFSPANLRLNILGDSVAYYKINKINAELPLDFVSRIETINTCRKLILDFRNNGGGDFLAGAQFLSYFINHRFTYFDYENIATGKIDPVIVKENSTPFSYRKDGKIIILIDESTACIAELVVNTLKSRRDNVWIIGKEPSRGALSFVYEINLPGDDIVIATNCLDTGRFLLNGKSIEGKGISPDIKVAINSIEDLQPYRDKVLTTAISK